MVWAELQEKGKEEFLSVLPFYVGWSPKYMKNLQEKAQSWHSQQKQCGRGQRGKLSAHGARPLPKGLPLPQNVLFQRLQDII